MGEEKNGDKEMTLTIIGRHGVITPRKKGESIKDHIDRHEKEIWIKTYMYIGDFPRSQAEKAWKEIFKK